MTGGDNLAANFSRELADYIIYVIDVAGGDKVPRKGESTCNRHFWENHFVRLGGPGVTQSDLLIVNKIDLAEAVGADLEVMKRDAKKMRGEGPTIFAVVKTGHNVDKIADLILENLKDSKSLAQESSSKQSKSE